MLLLVMSITGCAELTAALSSDAPQGVSVAMKPGSDWLSARSASSGPPSIDKDAAVAKLTLLVKKDPQANLKSLVQALTAGKANDFQRVRAIHDWITKNIAYDFAAFNRTAPTITDPYPVLRHGSSICYGYSQLFALMCTQGNIRAEVVVGYGRGAGYDAFKEDSLPYDSQHAWNAVLIGEGWYLVDTTWDAGGLDSRTNEFTWSYSTGYLFTPADVFLHTHFPDNPSWQLRDAALDLKGLRAQPYLRGSFGTLGLQYGTGLAKLASVDEEQEISFTVPEGIQVTATLNGEGAPDNVGVSHAAVLRDGSTVRVKAFFPAPGRYELSLFAVKEGDRSSFATLGALYFVASRASPKRAAFMESEGRSSGIVLDSAEGYVYRVGSTATFSYSGSTDSIVMMSDSSGQTVQDRTSMARDGNHRTVTISFPKPGDYTVWIATPTLGKAGSWTGSMALSWVAQEGSVRQFPQPGNAAQRVGLVLDSTSGYNPAVGAEAKVSFRLKGPITAALFGDGNASINGGTFVQSEGDTQTVLVSFPKRGGYTLMILVPSAGGKGSTEMAVLYKFQAQSGSDRLFPVMFIEAVAPGFQLVGPLDGTLKSGQDIAIEARGPATGSVSVQVDGKRVLLNGENGRFRGTVRAAGKDLYVVCKEKPGAPDIYLAQYSVR